MLGPLPFQKACAVQMRRLGTSAAVSAYRYNRPPGRVGNAELHHELFAMHCIVFVLSQMFIAPGVSCAYIALHSRASQAFSD